jgi:hypothetical protein
MDEQKKDSKIKISLIYEKQKRLPYKKPNLEELGDLRLFTLGPTPGGGESNDPFLFLGN